MEEGARGMVMREHGAKGWHGGCSASLAMRIGMGWLAMWGVAIGAACSDDAVVATGSDAGADARFDAPRELDATAERDASAERDAGRGSETASTETGADVVDAATSADVVDAAPEGNGDAEVERDAANDARVEADVASCTGASV